MGNIAAAVLILLLAAPAAFATKYTVGDSGGWTNGGDYSTWASGKTFNVGDSLVFNYGGSHAVSEVSQADYSSCSASNPLQTYNDGSTTIPLSKTGPMYFICPTAGHCGQGMKLAITVAAASNTPSTPTTPTPTSPSGGSTPPSGGSTTPSTTPSSPGVSPPPPKSSGADSILYNMMLGVLLVLGTTVAFMG